MWWFVVRGVLVMLTSGAVLAGASGPSVRLACVAALGVDGGRVPVLCRAVAAGMAEVLGREVAVVAGAADVVEDDVIAQPRAAFMVRLVKAVDHRQSVALAVGQAGTDQASRGAIRIGFAVFDNPGFDRAMLNHVGEIAFVHRGHPAAGMALAFKMPDNCRF